MESLLSEARNSRNRANFGGPKGNLILLWSSGLKGHGESFTMRVGVLTVSRS